jgi:diphosphomevalonate decarboxylase
VAVTAQAGANIALIKYWGKRDIALNLPTTGSLSITLDGLITRTRVEHDAALTADALTLNGQVADATRISACLDLLRARFGDPRPLRVTSDNTFPTAAGLASSASAFAALVVAANGLLGGDADLEQCSVWARRGSGSAARSLFDGFVVWDKGQRADGEDSVARRLQPADWWPLEVVIAVTDAAPKAVGSSQGMLHTQATSPLYAAWVEDQAAALKTAEQAVMARDFEALALATEASTLGMHATAMAARPGLMYWQPATLACMQAVRTLRADGVGVFFTVDAGPQVKAICLPEASAQVAEAFSAVEGVTQVLHSGLGTGAKVVA